MRQLTPLAATGDWPAFFAAIRDGHAEMGGDIARLNEAYRLARSWEPTEGVPGFRHVEIAILRNATLEPWLPHAFAALVARGVIPRFWLGDYGVYEGYLTGAVQGWSDAEPDVTLLYIDPEELAGDGALIAGAELGQAVEERLEGIARLVSHGSSGTVVQANLTPPPHGFRPVYDSQSSSSWPNIRRRINLTLVERFQDDPSVFLLDLDALACRFGAARARDPRMYFSAHVPFSVEFMAEVARAFAAVVAPLFVASRKCVIVDGDNTLWGGILGEDGPEGVEIGTDFPGSLYRRFQLFLSGLSHQGTLLALNSKNNESDVMSFLASSPDVVLRAEDFAAWRVNWEDKATNLRELVAELNIGLDSVVFVDDSEVECELIRSLMPEVRVETFPSDPIRIPDFIERFPEVETLRVTDEDRLRAASIRTDAQRERLKTEARDLDEFIRRLGIELSIRCQPADLVGRVAQLTQRTNQFNLTTRRYSETEVRSWMTEGLVYSLAMSDRFSDYGAVGVAIVDPRDTEAELDTLLLSCRAFGREVEQVFLDAVLQDLSRRGVVRVWGRYEATPKNAMVADFYARCGFERVEGRDESARFRIDLRDREPAGDASRYVIQTEGLA